MLLSSDIKLQSLPEIAASQLVINPAEALRYLQHRGEPAPELASQLSKASAAVLAAATPRYVVRAFDICAREPIQLSGTTLQLPGQAISALLQDSATCLIMAATIGAQVDELIRRAQITDVAWALLLDACASCAIENLVENLVENICNQAKTQITNRCYLTQRFSPGYGDLPLALQSPLCTVLDTTRRIGLTVSQSGLLLPRKSVTAIMGVCSKPQEHIERGCATCNMADSCPYRQSGQPCHKNQL